MNEDAGANDDSYESNKVLTFRTGHEDSESSLAYSQRQLNNDSAVASVVALNEKQELDTPLNRPSVTNSSLASASIEEVKKVIISPGFKKNRVSYFGRMVEKKAMEVPLEFKPTTQSDLNNQESHVFSKRKALNEQSSQENPLTIMMKRQLIEDSEQQQLAQPRSDVCSSHRQPPEQLEINRRVSEIIEAVPYDTLTVIKRAVLEREAAQSLPTKNNQFESKYQRTAKAQNNLYKQLLETQARIKKEGENYLENDEYRFPLKDVRQRPESEINFSSMKTLIKNQGADIEDPFISSGKIVPQTWFKDTRQLKEKNDDKQDYENYLRMRYQQSIERKQYLALQDSSPEQLEKGQLGMGAESLTPSQLKKLSQISNPTLVASSYESRVIRDNDSISETESDKEESKDKLQNSCTLTNELVTAHETEHNFLNGFHDSYYERIVKVRKEKMKSTILRFVKKELPERNKNRIKGSNSNCLNRKTKKKKKEYGQSKIVTMFQKKKFTEMSPNEKRERINYLWFRLRCIKDAVNFCNILKANAAKVQEMRMTKTSMRVIYEDSGNNQANFDSAEDTAIAVLKTIWYLIVSLMLWFNLVTTPFIILYPELEDIQNLYYMLWFNELVWVLDIIRKFGDKPKKSKAQDAFEHAIAYMKSYLIIDFASTFPQIASGLNVQFAPLKIIRIYQVQLLHYPLEVLISMIYNKSDKRQKYVIVYAAATLCRIAILLHFLAIVWVYIGSDHFIGFEVGYDPWTISNSDFHDTSKWQNYIFSVYWVCTVVTTVGYGDYTGGTTLEFIYTLLLEFFGIVVFSALQISVQLLVNHDVTFSNYVKEMDQRVMIWLMDLERSNFPVALSSTLYDQMKDDLFRSFRNDHNLIVKEFKFFYKLSPKIQTDLVRFLFNDFLQDFSDIFEGCEKSFINHLVVNLSYSYYEHGQHIQTSEAQCTKVYFIYSGGIALCENTCYGEPILIYGKGGVINLYQVLMNAKLKFKFIAVSQGSFDENSHEIILTKSQQVDSEEFFKLTNFDKNFSKQNGTRPNIQKKSCHYAEFYNIEAQQLLDLCKNFKQTSDYLQEYCIEQVMHLNKIRQTKKHLHKGNFINHYYRKHQKFLERKADVESDFEIDIQTLNQYQIKSAIELSLTHLGELVEDIESTIFGKWQQHIWKTNIRQTQKCRNDSNIRLVKSESSDSFKTDRSSEDSKTDQSQAIQDSSDKSKSSERVQSSSSSSSSAPPRVPVAKSEEVPNIEGSEQIEEVQMDSLEEQDNEKIETDENEEQQHMKEVASTPSFSYVNQRSANPSVLSRKKKTVYKKSLEPDKQSSQSSQSMRYQKHHNVISLGDTEITFSELQSNKQNLQMMSHSESDVKDLLDSKKVSNKNQITKLLKGSYEIPVNKTSLLQQEEESKKGFDQLSIGNQKLLEDSQENLVFPASMVIMDTKMSDSNRDDSCGQNSYRYNKSPGEEEMMQTLYSNLPRSVSKKDVRPFGNKIYNIRTKKEESFKSSRPIGLQMNDQMLDKTELGLSRFIDSYRESQNENVEEIKQHSVSRSLPQSKHGSIQESPLNFYQDQVTFNSIQTASFASEKSDSGEQTRRSVFQGEVAIKQKEQTIKLNMNQVISSNSSDQQAASAAQLEQMTTHQHQSDKENSSGSDGQNSKKQINE